MRHFFIGGVATPARAVAALALGVAVAAAAAALVARPGGTNRGAPRRLAAAASAVLLSAVTVRADQHPATTARA